MDILYSINKNYRIVTKHTMLINIQAHNNYKHDEIIKYPDQIIPNTQLCEEMFITEANLDIIIILA
jgi:hypothetical protein